MRLVTGGPLEADVCGAGHTRHTDSCAVGPKPLAPQNTDRHVRQDTGWQWGRDRNGLGDSGQQGQTALKPAAQPRASRVALSATVLWTGACCALQADTQQGRLWPAGRLGSSCVLPVTTHTWDSRAPGGCGVARGHPAETVRAPSRPSRAEWSAQVHRPGPAAVSQVQLHLGNSNATCVFIYPHPRTLSHSSSDGWGGETSM